MKKLLIIFFIFSLLILNLSFVNSKFVCGFVNNSEEYSSSWMNVIVYPEENISKFVNCKINPEHKFCCDLDEIPSINQKVGKRFFAEVFDKETGFIAGPTSLYLTDEGYDIFPEMNIQRAIKIISPSNIVFINKSFISIEGYLVQNYNNLKYKLNSSSGFFEQQVCINCTSFEFTIPLEKGRNELILVAYGNREISEKIILYNLDYFNFKLNAFCDKCRTKGKYIYVPAGKEVIFSSYFNSSHPISGNFLFYTPLEWNLTNSSILSYFSPTHLILTEKITEKREFSKNYTLQSPKTLIQKLYPFYQEFEDKNLTTNVILFRSNLIPFRQKKNFEQNYFTGLLSKKCSPSEPIILNSDENFIKLIAIFPKSEITKSYSNLEFVQKKFKGKNKEYSFKILTSLSEKEIERILLVFKVEKGKTIEVYNSKDKINLELYEEEQNYTYYSAFLNEKGPFRVKIF